MSAFYKWEFRYYRVNISHSILSVRKEAGCVTGGAQEKYNRTMYIYGHFNM